MANPFSTEQVPLPGAKFGDQPLVGNIARAAFDAMSEDKARKFATKFLDNIGVSSNAADSNAVSMALTAIQDKPMLATNIVQALGEPEILNING